MCALSKRFGLFTPNAAGFSPRGRAAACRAGRAGCTPADGLVAALGVFFFVSGPRMHRLADDRTDLMASISVEADDEYNSFAADFEAFENKF